MFFFFVGTYLFFGVWISFLKIVCGSEDGKCCSWKVLEFSFIEYILCERIRVYIFVYGYRLFSVVCFGKGVFLGDIEKSSSYKFWV